MRRREEKLVKKEEEIRNNQVWGVVRGVLGCIGTSECMGIWEICCNQEQRERERENWKTNMIRDHHQ
jgi:hypothetical protein